MHFIGIDIGTSSISGVVYDYETGNMESATLANDSALASADGWEKIQDPARIWELVLRMLEDFFSRYPDIKGLGMTGQMHGILYVDKDGNALSPLFTWQDGRGNLPYKDNKTYASFLTGLTGCGAATGYGLVTHFYNSVNGLVPTGAARLCTIMDYAVMKLSGAQEPLTDYSNGAGLGFFDAENLRFDRAALAKTGIDLSFLPRLERSGVLCGYYKGDVPVYSAIGDNQAAFLGSVSDIDRTIHVTVGTSSQISVYSEKYVRVPGLDTRPFPGGGYILVGAALCGGSAFAMLKDFMKQVLELFTGESPADAELYRIMASVPYKGDPEDIPVVKTLFDGTRYAPGERGSIENISLGNFTPGNLTVGFLKGIAGELYGFYDAIPVEVKGRKTMLVGSGNALKNNPILRRAFAERFGYDVILSPCGEEAAFGACVCAVTGYGLKLKQN